MSDPKIKNIGIEISKVRYQQTAEKIQKRLDNASNALDRDNDRLTFAEIDRYIGFESTDKKEDDAAKRLRDSLRPTIPGTTQLWSPDDETSSLSKLSPEELARKFIEASRSGPDFIDSMPDVRIAEGLRAGLIIDVLRTKADECRQLLDKKDVDTDVKKVFQQIVDEGEYW